MPLMPQPLDVMAGAGAEPFEFSHASLPTDGDLQLALHECVTAAASPWAVPVYTFNMLAFGEKYAGFIRLRVGWNEHVIRYAGHVGYGVEPAYRGRHYAERACRLIAELARRHGMAALWITCQPDNLASRRTLERLGATCVGILDVPPEYPLASGAERRKLCFNLRLA